MNCTSLLQQLRNSSVGRDGVPQLLRAIAVLKEAEEENASVDRKRKMLRI